MGAYEAYLDTRHVTCRLCITTYSRCQPEHRRTFQSSFLSEILLFGNIASLYHLQMTRYRKRHWRRGLRDPSSLHASNETAQIMQVGYLRRHAMQLIQRRKRKREEARTHAGQWSPAQEWSRILVGAEWTLLRVGKVLTATFNRRKCT